jgi:predicted enzyme related to lactoylglutathione lyase
VKLEVCIDVDDVDRAVAFYGRGLGLEVTEHQPDWAQLKLDEQTFWIMRAAPGSQGPISRDYRRHWTPIHLDFLVDDIDEAVQRALAAGGRLDREITRDPDRADLANLSDPAGNGIDLVQRHEQQPHG